MEGRRMLAGGEWSKECNAIECKDLSFRYFGAKDYSLKNIDLMLKKGEVVLVVGKSGSGKSTITRIINGLCPMFYGGVLEGEYLLNGERVLEKSLSDVGSEVGSVFQDPRSQFFARTVQDELVLAMENHCFERDVMRENLERVTKLLNIEDLLEREMMSLSSGQKQKVAIASVFALNPNVLVLDEPSANLDKVSTDALRDFLKYAKEQGKTIVISEHRLHYLRDIVDRVFLVEEGEITKDWSRDEFLEMSALNYEEYGLRDIHLSEPLLSENPKIVSKSSDKINESQRPFLVIRDVCYFARKMEILKDINFTAEMGEVTVVKGVNGSGKTTLMKIITGVLKESKGTLFCNQKIFKQRERFRKTFFVQQDVDYQLYETSVLEEFLIGTTKADEKSVLSVLEEVGLSHVVHKHPQILSGGQKQRLLVGLAKSYDREIMVFDEPTSGLDRENMKKVAKILKEMALQNKCVIVVTHDEEFISLVADKVYCMQ